MCIWVHMAPVHMAPVYMAPERWLACTAQGPRKAQAMTGRVHMVAYGPCCTGPERCLPCTAQGPRRTQGMTGRVRRGTWHLCIWPLCIWPRCIWPLSSAFPAQLRGPQGRKALLVGCVGVHMAPVHMALCIWPHAYGPCAYGPCAHGPQAALAAQCGGRGLTVEPRGGGQSEEELASVCVGL